MAPDTSLALTVTVLWMKASRARHHLERVLHDVGLTFPVWWVLATTERLIFEKANDPIDPDWAVSQREVGLATELDKNTVSFLMKALSNRGLVDRSPGFGYREYRVILTEKGTALVLAAHRAIERTLSAQSLFDPIPPKR